MCSVFATYNTHEACAGSVPARAVGGVPRAARRAAHQGAGGSAGRGAGRRARDLHAPVLRVHQLGRAGRQAHPAALQAAGTHSSAIYACDESERAT